MPGFFQRFFLSGFGPPPAPDITELPSFTGERIVETVYSASKRERVFITVDEAEDHRIYFQLWDTSDWKAGHGARWSCPHSTGSHTDSLDRARELAGEEMRCSRYDG
jgi:hypothetical protein